MSQYHEVTGDHPVLQRWASGEWVSYAQQLLTSAGYPPQDHQIDGLFGPLTQEAVRDFQGAHGLTVDGIIGPATWAALESSSSNGSGSLQLEYAAAPAIQGGGLQWTVRNSGTGPAAAGESAGSYEMYDSNNTTIPGGSVPLASELAPGTESGTLGVNLIEHTPNDGSYQASVQLGNDIHFVDYLVEHGSVRTP
ncbi:MAG TPA: peptidoglycan-binding domain-containing protein [Actinophytocola sp.]|uniref:peptidoglycan-binding domain-containing protein n=1 Tax=Actinophytocola sp. TaxID=1872138 RepID=UPI002DB7E0E7|nr:peptidoglycan-binding domain-containing protein [Actinophytocola sp.]HEU5472481.1 peptidoglycan-binding domain-containing protein [Actinophytocola sp.]